LIVRMTNTLMATAAVAALVLAGPVWKEPVAGSEPSKTAGASPAAKVELSGKVVGPDGKAVPGAPVYLVRGKLAREQEYGFGRPLPAPAPRAITGPDGEFQFRLTPADLWTPNALLMAADPAYAGREPVPAGGFGVGWEMAWAFDLTGTLRKAAGAVSPEREKPVLRLVKDDVPLTGRIVDPDGRPVKGASIGLICVYRTRGEDLTGFLQTLQKENGDYDDVRQQHASHMLGSDFIREEELARCLRTETDAEGRFTLRGIGRERIVWLWVEGPGIRTGWVFARTRPGPAIPVEHCHPNPGDIFTLYGAGFEHRAERSVPMAGVVRDLDTGKPVAGALVRTILAGGQDSHRGNIAQAITDEAGRFRLTGVPPGDVALIAVPLDQPYLTAVQKVSFSGVREAAPVEFKLKRGVWVRGRVTDARTGRPLPAAIQYFAPASNPNLVGIDGYAGSAPYPPVFRTDADGQYAVPGLPGQGIVAARVRGPGFDDYMLGTGVNDINPGRTGKGWMAWLDTLPEPCTANRFHALVKIDVPSDAKAAKAPDLKPDTGDTLTGTILDAGGQPLAGAIMLGARQTSMLYIP
jgi:protocatechuate 3,4-dioxygenase beta subunit